MISICLQPCLGSSQTESRNRVPTSPLETPVSDGPIETFSFDGNLRSTRGSQSNEPSERAWFTGGLDGQALHIGGPSTQSVQLLGGKHSVPTDRDFSIQFWIRTIADDDQRFVVLSQKAFADNSLASQKQAGWLFLVSHGTWAWNIGSGNRRVVYERDNGSHMPLNDGRWHQLSLTYEHDKSLIRLFYDGDNQVTYNLHDTNGFDFSNPHPLVAGWGQTHSETQAKSPSLISEGAKRLQELVTQFNGLGLPSSLEDDDLMELIIRPKRLFENKLQHGVQRVTPSTKNWYRNWRLWTFPPSKRWQNDCSETPIRFIKAPTS